MVLEGRSNAPVTCAAVQHLLLRRMAYAAVVAAFDARSASASASDDPRSRTRARSVGTRINDRRCARSALITSRYPPSCLMTSTEKAIQTIKSPCMSHSGIP
jgi:hypothetical protein